MSLLRNTLARIALVAALVAVLPALAAVGVGVGAPAHAESARHAAVQARPVTYTVYGRVVRFVNGRPVQGVRISVTEGNATDVRGSDITDARGRFSITFLAADDGFGVLVRGRRVGFQNGWVGCNLTVKPTFGAACVHGEKVAPIRIKAV